MGLEFTVEMRNTILRSRLIEKDRKVQVEFSNRCHVWDNGKNKGTFAAPRGLLRLLAAKLLESSRKSMRKIRV